VLIDSLEPVPGARREPCRPGFLVAVEVANEPELGEGCSGGQPPDRPVRRGLLEPRLGLVGHRRPAFGHDDDPGRLVGVVLADDEFGFRANGRNARGGLPVDGGWIVARPIGPRAGDAGTHAAPISVESAER
jgi:hypothetical protein